MICGNAPGPIDPPPPADDAIPCCMGAALDGHTACTCWEPVHDVDQADVSGDDTVLARRGRCDDCAYRPDSPEQDNPSALPVSQAFWCHQGMRRIVGWRHPDGRYADAGDGAYNPPIIDGIPRLADGSKAVLCAGWLAERAADNIRQRILHD